jgi:ATP-grasp domain, R2K clade family 3
VKQPRLSPAVKWIVQSNLGNNDTFQVIRKACEKHGLLIEGVTVIPFSPDLPDIKYDGPVLIYGATQFVKRAVAMGIWKPGAFFDPLTFTVDNCLARWGGWMVNHDSKVIPMACIQELPYAPDDLVFVRPNSDFKEFAGNVMSYSELCAWCDTIAKGGFEFDSSLLVAVATPKPIASEWRVFVIEDKGIVAATLYRSRGRLMTKDGAPEEVLEFVKERVREWMPSPAFALDIAEVEGSLRILELSDIHSCGHYASDVESIVMSMSDVAIQYWRLNQH